MHGPIISKVCAGVLAAQMLIAPGVRTFCVGPNCPPVQQATPVYFDAVPQAFDLPVGPEVPSGWVWEPSPGLVESELLDAPTEEPAPTSEETAQTPESDGSPTSDAKPAEAPKAKSKATTKATAGRWVYYQPQRATGGVIARMAANAGCGCPNCTCGPGCQCGTTVSSYASSGGANYVSYSSAGDANYVQSRTVTYAGPMTTWSRTHTNARPVLFPRLFPRLRGLR